MSVLHYLGLNDSFKGIFTGLSIEQGINELCLSNNDDYSEIIALLSLDTGFNTVQDDIENESKDYYEVRLEGKKKLYYTTRYERSAANRGDAIKIHGTVCMVCGFDFEKFYGKIGQNYIEVHHIKPLADINAEVEINPQEDLAVLCSNCHRMIHRRKNCVLTLDELRKIIDNEKQNCVTDIFD